MAANEYFNSGTWNTRPPIDYNAPLPPVPPSEPGKASGYPTTNVQHIASPFDDHAYPASDYQSQPYGRNQDYYEAGGGSGHQLDPSADYIPLTNHPSNAASDDRHGKNQPLYNPGFGGGAAELGDVKDRPKRRRRNPKNPKGRTPWFSYIMTLIQVTVFIVEIAKNCKQGIRSLGLTIR